MRRHDDFGAFYSICNPEHFPSAPVQLTPSSYAYESETPQSFPHRIISRITTKLLTALVDLVSWGFLNL